MRSKVGDVRRSVLMVAFHFPPAAMGSGHLRTLGFARYLPESGWDPIVLSARALAYPHTDRLDTDSIPPGCVVQRALALDARRHFGIAGRYPAFLAQPDRWGSWWPAAVWQGLRLIRRYRVRAIWSTYPIMTAHCVAQTLSRLTKLPWVADFRDPVLSSVSPENAFTIASQRRWEQRVLTRATNVVVTTPGALHAYAERYPAARRQNRLTLIPNGYDEAAFSGISRVAPSRAGRPLIMVHSGNLYPHGRDPVAFFEALARLQARGQVGADDVRIVLRDCGSEAEFSGEIRRLRLERWVTVAPTIPYRQALEEQAQADALLIFQGTPFDHQIPGKLYEYLRVGRPIFALVGKCGDTAALLRETGGAEFAPLDDVAQIEENFSKFVVALREGQPPLAAPSAVAKYSRRNGAGLLAALLNRSVA